MHELSQTCRALLRRPGLLAAALLTLALGIGVNTALFSVFKAVVLEPLPYRDPGSLTMIWSRWTGYDKTWVSFAEYQNYRENLQSFDDIALFQTFEANFTGEDPERIPAASVTPNLFEVVGVLPAQGRAFDARDVAEDRTEVVILSHGLWQGRFGGRADAVGSTISLNGRPRVVVGVMPREFRMPLDYGASAPVQMLLPARVPAFSGEMPQNGGSHGAYTIGRLLPGATLEQANAELGAMTSRWNAEGIYPPNWNFEALVVGIDDQVIGELRPALLVLLGAVGLVLLIACANVTNLLLVWSEERRRETGVRGALGAGRRRLIRQRLVESGLLAGAGAVLGLIVAWIVVRLLAASAPAALARVSETVLDGQVLAFTTAAAILAALLAGALPAIHAARINPAEAVRSGGGGNLSGRSRETVRRGIIVAEIALAVVLVIGAGLTLRSFWNLVSIDPGFDAENVVTMRVAPNQLHFPEDTDVTRYYAEVLSRVRSMPGVETAGLIRLLPIDTEIGDASVEIEGVTAPAGTYFAADWQAVSPGYFEAIGTRIVDGRSVTDGDDASAPLAILVNEAFVRVHLDGGEAVGRRMRLGFGGEPPWQTIVGVVADTRHNGITGEARPTFFRPHAQWAVPSGEPRREMTLVARTTGDAVDMLQPVRNQVVAVDGRVPVSRVQTMEEVLGGALSNQRFMLQLIAAFGALALVLAVIGVYSVMSYLVTTRRRETGIRIALGAGRSRVVWAATREGLTQAAVGVAIGLTVAAMGARLMSGLLYGVGTLDLLTYAVVAGLLLAVSLAATWLPARRAATVDPMAALRQE